MSYCSPCQLVHGEEHRFCQRCGQILKGSPTASRACARCGTLTFPGQRFCTECGLPLRVARVAQEDEAPPVFYPRDSETKVRRHQPRRPGRALITLLSLFLVVIVAYGAWRMLPSPRTQAPQTPAPVTAPQEDLRREVEKLAEKIRAAHLNKDINKWLNCYNSAYPNLGERERGVLELWKNFDVKSIEYRISNVQRQGEKQVSADLIWSFQLYNHKTHDYDLVRDGYKVILEKSGGEWRIKDSKQNGGGAS